MKIIDQSFGHIWWASVSKCRSHFCFYGFNLPQITCPDVWINYNAVVQLPHSHGILHSETDKPTVYILFQYPILLLQIVFMFQGGWNSTVNIVTYCELGGLGFKCWWGKMFWTHPDQPWGPTSLLYKEYWVCFLEMKWPGCGADRQSLLVLRSCIQRAIPLLPLCACLTYNGTAITFIHIQIPYKHTTSDDSL